MVKETVPLYIVCCAVVIALVGVQSCFGAAMTSFNNGNIVGDNALSSSSTPNIVVLYSASAVDKEFQLELLKAVFASLRDADSTGESLFVPDFIELSNTVSPTQAAHRVWANSSQSVISLLCESQLSQFASAFDTMVTSTPRISSALKIYTPRLIEQGATFPSTVSIYSTQMNTRAVSLALLNRVGNVGINTLIPVLDSGDEYQRRWLALFEEEGRRMGKPVGFTSPVFIDNPEHLESFRQMLDEQTGIKGDGGGGKQFGVMLLAKRGSSAALRVAGEKKHMQVGWFSPSILDHEEWAYTWRGEGDEKFGRELRSEDNSIGGNNNYTFNSHFGLYTVNFVGSAGWDNPSRRRMLRELTKYTGASPRILSSVLAYDSATLAVNYARGVDQRERVLGLSGEIEFDSHGHRKNGMFFGVSAVPELASPTATLLQPSTWILEDSIFVKESPNAEGYFVIQEFHVATSSLLSGTELRALANRTRMDVGCTEHIMNLITHDPFNQMPYNYYFKEENLPENLLIPNQHGFGITFLCFHGQSGNETSESEPLTTTLQVACTPGAKLNDSIQCFRSQVNKVRQKRSPATETIPTQYQYGFGQGGDNWNLPQNSKWSNPKEDASNNQYYQNYFPSTPSPIYKRLDTSVAASSDAATTAAPPTSKLPELRQILKAAKPFVGSCIGSTTGCAMCVLVLGRLPLGAVPAACTGPCFVGTFGSCGSLLGRVFSETTVICTELFRQGLMDPETFMADVEFGRLIHEQFPTTMQGYTLLASPIVDAMKTSPLVSRIVSFFALPWANHMKFLAGRTSEPSITGLFIHTMGFPICNIAGYIHSIYTHYQFNYIYDNIGSTFTLLAILILTIILVLTNSNSWKPVFRIFKIENIMKHFRFNL